MNRTSQEPLRGLDEINEEAEAKIAAIRRIAIAQRERLAQHLEMTEGVGALL